MKRSFALRILLLISAVGVLSTPGALSAQDTSGVMELTAPVQIPAVPRTVDAARFSPAAVAAAADDERPPQRGTLSESRHSELRRQVRRRRFRRAAIITAVLAGVVAAAVGVSKLTPEPRERESERDGRELLGLLILLGG